MPLDSRLRWAASDASLTQALCRKPVSAYGIELRRIPAMQCSKKVKPAYGQVRFMAGGNVRWQAPLA
jgi:hypothetical protein